MRDQYDQDLQQAQDRHDRDQQRGREQYDRDLQREQDQRAQLVDGFEGQITRMRVEQDNLFHENVLLQSRLPPSDLTRRSGGIGFTIDDRDDERGRSAPGAI